MHEDKIKTNSKATVMSVESIRVKLGQAGHWELNGRNLPRDALLSHECVFLTKGCQQLARCGAYNWQGSMMAASEN